MEAIANKGIIKPHGTINHANEQQQQFLYKLYLP